MEELLAKIGLERLWPQFEKEEIDVETLRIFEDQDLIELGIPKGPRVKLLRAIREVYAGRPPQNPETLDRLLVQVDALVERVDGLQSQLADVSTRHEKLEAQAAKTSEDFDLGDLTTRVRELSLAMQAAQELAPRQVCWEIKHVTEKLLTIPPGKHIRAPPFQLCGSVVNLKLDFFPTGRHEVKDAVTEEATRDSVTRLPDITPRHPDMRGKPDVTPRHPDVKEVRPSKRPALPPEESWCSVGICCPMGVKVVYSLRIGRCSVDGQKAEWTPVYHDFRVRWGDEMGSPPDDSIRVLLTLLRVHNRRLPIENSTVFVQSG